jgi:hypothetical protein
VRSWRTRNGGRRGQPKIRRLDTRSGQRSIELGSKHCRLDVAELVRTAFPDIGATPASDPLLGALDRARSELKAATLESAHRGDDRTADLLTRIRDILGRTASTLARNAHEAAP